jgi:DNA mismatch endonuclease (patch repair protein)
LAQGWGAGVATFALSPAGLILPFTRARVAVFCDGAFWHGHPDHFTLGKLGPYWDSKITRTQERDRQANKALADMGWAVLRFWDFEIARDPESCAMRTADEVQSRRAEADIR